MSQNTLPKKTITAELSITLGPIRLQYQDDQIRAHIEYTITLNSFGQTRSLDFPASPTLTLADLQSIALQQIQTTEGL
jgi:hypothetical protein